MLDGERAVDLGVVLDLAALHVERQVDEDRARPAFLRDAERLAEDPRDLAASRT